MPVSVLKIEDHEREMLEAADSNKSDHRQAQATHLQHLLTQLLSAQQLPALSAQESSTLPGLQAYGHLRYALAACAALLRTYIIQAKEPVTVDDWLSQLLQQVHDVCCLDEADRPRWVHALFTVSVSVSAQDGIVALRKTQISHLVCSLAGQRCSEA